MKKLLNILGVVTVLSGTSSMVVSCDRKTGGSSDATLESSATELSKLAIASQYGDYALNPSDALSYLKTQNKNLQTNINKYFMNEGTEKDFVNSQGKIGLSDDSDDVSRSSSIIPDIDAPGMGDMSIENVVGSLPTILSVSGSVLLPIVIKTIAPNFDQKVLEEIFSSKILTSNGDILKNTIGTIDKSGNWVISPTNNPFYGKSYNDVFSSIIPNFSKSLITIYNGIKNKTINIDNINTQDISNIFTGVFVLMNYFSQFNFISTIDFQTSGQLLYNDSGVKKTDNEYNETCKGDILNKTFTSLNSQNISNLFTNLGNADTNNGLGIQQLLFTIFGGAKSGSTTTPLNNQPLGKMIEDIGSSMFPTLNKDTIGIGLYAIGEIFGTIAENDKINSIIDMIDLAMPALPDQYKSAVENFVSAVKSNKNWYSQGEPKGGTPGTIWNDIWSGTGKNSFLDVIWSSFGGVVPSLASLVGVADNISNIYEIMENLPISLSLPSLGNQSTNSNGETPKTSFNIKELFQVLGSKGNLINTFLSPQLFDFVEGTLANLQDPTIIDTFKKDYNSFISTFGKDINKGQTDPHLDFVANAEKDNCANALTYVIGENIAFMDSSKSTDESTQINSDFRDFAVDVLKINDVTSNFSQFLKHLGNALVQADTDVFDNYVQFTFSAENWKESKITKNGNNYQFYLSTKSFYYNVEIIKDSSDNYYKLSINQTE